MVDSVGTSRTTQICLVTAIGVFLFSSSPQVSGQATDSDSKVDGILNCGPLSTNPTGAPAFSRKISFNVSKGTLSADDKILRPKPGRVEWSATVDQGTIALSSRGRYDDDSDGWVHQLSGRVQDTGDTVLEGTLRNGWGKGNGTRNCSLTFLLSSTELKGKLAATGPTTTTNQNDKSALKSDLNRLEDDQKRLLQQQAATDSKLSEVKTFLGGIVLPAWENPEGWMMRVAAVPIQQQQFCRIVDKFYNDLAEVEKTRNEIKRNALFRDRQGDMATLLPRGEFQNWVVQIKEVTQAADGSAAVMLQPPCRAMLGSDACQMNGSKVRATISVTSPLYRELGRVSAGDFVVVSGRLLYAESEMPDQPLPTYAVYKAGSHCSPLEGSKQGDVFVTEVGYLVQLR